VETPPTCFEKYPALRGFTAWAPTGAGSVALFAGAQRADFSPVQAGAGVYLRGGFSGDPKLYEMRRRNKPDQAVIACANDIQAGL
jgi:hypothetical protein